MSDQEMCDRLIDKILAIYKKIDKGEIDRGYEELKRRVMKHNG